MSDLIAIVYPTEAKAEDIGSDYSSFNENI